ncbi:LOW QUALITY PROTEIN: hypothetical protein QTO34_000759 [Cnephaeus nilssonii]|uniref:Rec21/ENK19 domain-containing protein n=1 Tax=Cnephaeus nilssonii TaxID=3371016 RepID=A0AA40IC10_CNENI|nr:LOW QUALITY PROTEIN: hypothetical protein QTO34_000759 [Eptesicus nilssonii]
MEESKLRDDKEFKTTFIRLLKNLLKTVEKLDEDFKELNENVKKVEKDHSATGRQWQQQQAQQGRDEQQWSCALPRLGLLPGHLPLWQCYIPRAKHWQSDITLRRKQSSLFGCQSSMCTPTVDPENLLVPPFKRLRVKKKTKAKQGAKVPTWGQLKKLTTEAQQMVKKQEVEATPSTIFLAMLALVSCQTSVNSEDSEGQMLIAGAAPGGQCTPSVRALLCQKPGSQLASAAAVVGASPTSVAALRGSGPSGWRSSNDVSSLLHLRSSSCKNSSPTIEERQPRAAVPSKEQQLCEQPAPIRGTAAPQASHPHSRSNSHLSSLPQTEEQQPHEQTTHV